MQKRFNEFQAELLSHESNEKYAGILAPSVYKGFDIIQARAGLGFQIAHTVTGEVFTNKDLTVTPPRGIWVSKQGTVIKEDATISVSILVNEYNYERWDVLVAEHIHDELTVGGLEATYTVIPGGDATEPGGISSTQIIIGRIRVPANANNSDAIIWERRPIPQLGGKIPALLAENNIFTGQNSERHRLIATSVLNLGGANRGLIQGMNDANSFTVDNAAGFTLALLPRRPLGTLISLTFKSNGTLSGFNNQLITGTNNLAGYDEGYRPLSLFTITPGLNFAFLAGETATFRMVDVSGPVTKRPYGEYWSLVGLTDSTGKSLEAFTQVSALQQRVALAEAAITQNGVGIRDVGDALNAHVGNTSNPHNTNKEQVGLGNIPNKKSDAIDEDDTASLATSKAVKLLNDALGTVRGTAQSALSSAMPKGGIIMWSGSTDNIPTGYVLCDGRSAINGQIIPDLRNKFIRGASDLQNTTNLDPDDRGQIATPAPVGAGGGNNRYALSLNEIPPHTHSYSYNTRTQMVSRGTGSASVLVWGGEENINSTTGSAGGSAGSAQEFNLMPQWYALAFIIKVI